MSSDQYCLRWNSYETNILATFEGLLDSEALSDVTLFCEGESFKAHRLVLAACSTHFSKIFANAPINGQLIVILDGTRSPDLQILLQFMYRGVAFLPSDRIESVLRTGEVLQVKGLFNADGLSARGGGGGGGSGRDNNGPHNNSNNTWSSPPHNNDNQKKEAESASSSSVGGAGRLLAERRDSSSPVPSGRIAVPPAPVESPLSAAHHSLPLFTQPAASASYTRHPFTALPPALYQNFTGFQRPDSANSKGTTATPTPSSVMSFGGGGSKSELPSPSHTPGGRDSTNSQYKFSPRRAGGGDRDGSDLLYDVVGKQEQLRRASPSLRRSSSEAFGEPRSNSSPPPSLRGAKQLMSSDSTTSDPSQSPSRRFPNETADRLRLKTEMPGSPVEPKRSFSGDFSSRESLGRLSSSTGLPLTRSEAEDLRTNDTEERIKRENNFETFRRLAHVNAVTAGSSGPGGGGGGGLTDRESQQLATIQKMAAAGRDHFLGVRGGFGAPLTAPLSIPASDLARIAQTVPDPAAVSGEPTSGTGTKLKCPFCERTYGYETNLRAHIRQRHQGIRVPCPFCHRSFTRNNTVRRHIAREHRHQVNPKMIPTKFGQTKVMPDQPYSDAMNQAHP